MAIMNEQQVRAVVAAVLARLTREPEVLASLANGRASAPASPIHATVEESTASALSTPPAMEGSAAPASPIHATVEESTASASPILAATRIESTTPDEDITTIDLRRQYLVAAPKNGEAFLALKESTPARVGVGRAGARCRTATMLRFQADHAAAQGAVFADVPDAFLSRMGLDAYSTACKSRDEFLTRPDLGRVFPPDVLAAIQKAVPLGLQVLLYLADGLSSTAITSNARDIVPVIVNGLKSYGVKVGTPFFTRYGRVGSMDCLGDALKPDVVCVLLGERPGLVTAESMSAYIAYRPTVGMPESRRTVVANIHRGGTPPVEAGAFIVDLIRLMLEKKASGLELPV
jgi:ethanolamine ammonia-lyase small subunit